MPTPKPLRRSVSPFGQGPTQPPLSDYAELQEAFAAAFGKPPEGVPHVLKQLADAVFLPSLIESTSQAAANDAVHLEKICQFALTHRIEFEGKNVQPTVFQAFEKIFFSKTELFLCNLSDASLSGRPSVLFSKERNYLVGSYFFPVCETTPADFSGFVQRWITSENMDRRLHFFDFCLGAHDPTFEYYLVFAHPGIKRIISNKNQIRTLWKEADALATKLAGIEWKKQVVSELGL